MTFSAVAAARGLCTAARRGATRRRDAARALPRPGRKKVLKLKLYNRNITGPELLNLMDEHVGTEAFEARNISMGFYSLGFKSFGALDSRTHAASRFRALRGDKQFDRMCRAAKESIERDQWTPPLLSRLVWGLTKLPRTAATEALFAAAARAIPAIVGDARPSSVANFAWAFATADIEAPKVFASLRTAVEASSSAELRLFRTRDLTITLWSFAKAGVSAPAMFDRLATEILLRDIAAFNDQSLSNTAWAFARAGHAAPALFSAIAEEMTPRIRECASQSLVNTVWAFARMDAPAPALFAAVAADAPRYLSGGSAQSVATLAWAFATAGVHAPAFYASAEREALKRGLGRMGDRGVANLVWAFAKADVDAPALYAAVATEFARPGEFLFTVTFYANLAHSLTRSP
jgi:hypothetical protein